MTSGAASDRQAQGAGVSADSDIPASSTASALAGLCGWAALLVPLVVGIGSARGVPDWGDDLGVVRNLGLVAIGSEGGVSTILCQLFGLLPLGGHLLRAEWVSAVALALSARLFYALLCRALESVARFAPNPVLALVGSLLAVLTPAARHEGSRVGGAALALALVLLGLNLLCLDLHQRPAARRDARLWPLIAALCGLSLSEDRVAGCALVAFGIGFALLDSRSLRSSRASTLALAALAGAVLGALAPALRAFGQGVWMHADAVVAGGAGAPSAPFGFVRGWVEQLGALGAGLAVCGGLVAAGPRTERRGLVVFAFLILFEACLRILGAAWGGVGAPILPLLSVCGAAGLLALGLQSAARWLWRAALPFTKPACALLLAFSITLVLGRLDESVAGSEQQAFGAEIWAEEALGKLPAQSVVLVQSSAFVLRLLSERVLHGVRPDVVVLPAALVAEAALSPRLLALEPRLTPLVRQLAVNGHADEYALCDLADARPLFVELDPEWDRRLFEHLRPQGIWLGFAPHTLGAADLRVGFGQTRVALREVLNAVEAAPESELRTRDMLARSVAEQAHVLGLVGDGEGARTLLRALRSLRPSDPVVASAR